MTEHRGDRDGYFIAGDALRGYAAVAVLLFHVYVAVILRNPQGGTLGHVGEALLWFSVSVFVFFILSGYLVGGPFVRAWIDGRPMPNTKKYIGRRLRRIVPAFWLVLVLLIGWFGTSGSSVREVLFMFGFAQSFDPGAIRIMMQQGWTLNIEMTFYLLLPLLGIALAHFKVGQTWSPRTRAHALFTVLAFVFVYGLVLRAGKGDFNGSYANIFTLSWALAPGVALAALETPLRAKFAASPKLGRRSAQAASVASIAAFAWLVHSSPALTDGFTNVLFAIVSVGLITAAMFWQWTTGGAPWIVNNRPMHALGRWSYGFYLVHIGIGLELLKHAPAGSNLKVFLFLAVGMLIGSTLWGAFSWWAIEQPILVRRAPQLPAWWPAPLVRRRPQAEEDARGIFIAGDTLRAFASTVVLVSHCVYATALLYGKSPLDAFGVLSDPLTRLTWVVFIFFSLSGYLVGGPFVRAWLRGSGRPDLRRYTGRRLRRIVPAFWVVLACLLIVFGRSGASIGQTLAAFGFAQNFARSGIHYVIPQAWTLDIEVMFYLALPLGMLAYLAVGPIPSSEQTRRRMLYGALLGALVLGVVWRSSVSGVEDGIGRNVLGLAHAFVPGMFLAAIEAPVKAAIRGTSRGKAWALGIAALFPVGWAWIMAAGLADGQLGFELASLLVAAGILGGPMLWQWTTASAPGWLDNRLFHALGRWSYGIFLIHLGVLLKVINHVPGSLSPMAGLMFVVGTVFAITVALSAVLYWLVEEPFMNKQLPRRFWQRAPEPVSPPSEEQGAKPALATGV